jgi:hypothetical protein
MHKYAIVLTFGLLGLLFLGYNLRWMPTSASQRFKFAPQPKVHKFLFECPHVSATSQFALDQLNHYELLKSRQSARNYSSDMNTASKYTLTVSGIVEKHNCFVIIVKEYYLQANQSRR